MATENFTTYEEVDTAGKLTVTAPKADANGVLNGTKCYLYKDFGSNHFNALDIDFEIHCENQATYPVGQCGIGLSNTINAPPDWSSDDPYVCMFDISATVAYVRIMHGDGGTGEDDYVGSTNTPYYCTMSKVLNNWTVSLLIYSDSGRTDLLDTLVETNFSNGLQYLYGFVAYYQTAVTRLFDGYVQNLNLNEGVVPTVPMGASMGSKLMAVGII